MSSKTKTTATNPDGEIALAPKLRFPEFLGGGPWNDVPIASILNIRDERRLPSTDAPLYSLTIENGVTAKTDRYNREFLVRDSGNKKYKLVEPNDIVFNPSNLRWGAINYSQLTHSVVVSPIYEVLSLGDSSANFLEFIACSVMRGEQIRRFIIKGQGTLVERIAVKVEDFLSTNLPVPPTRAEQQKIAECLSSVDELMAVQARKVDALKTHKKGLMQQLFPREGETQPHLRFPEFQNAGEWEVQRLDELARYENGKAHENDISENGPYIVVNSKFISTEGEVRKFSNEAFCVADEGDVLMVLSDVPNGRAIAKCYFVESDDLYTVNQRICRIQPTKVNGRFLFYVLNRNSYFLDFDDGVKQTNLRKEDVVGFPLCVPPQPDEQQKIAECLSSLDALITAETQKHEALKTHKKGLMQQLFPSVQEAAA